MTPELFWLALSALFLLVCWLPYIANRSLVRGAARALGNPRDDDKPQDSWAQRAQFAHNNGVENLVVMGALVLIANAAKITSDTTIMLVQLYFWARIAHYLVYTIGIPYARTATFFVGWIATAWLGLIVVGVL